jgi:hypothetical protein
MNRELLETPFPADMLRQRKGNFGKTLDYVETHAVIKRLNDALESNWSFEILEHRVMEQANEVVVLGKLSSDGISKCQFGSSSITRVKETGEIVSLADDLKAAASDSLKKCASLLGVGLHLYGAGQPTGNTRQNVTSITTGKGTPPAENTNGRISAKQHQYVLNLAQGRGMTKKELNDHCVGAFGAGVDFINRKDASALIESMRIDKAATA